MSTLARPPFPIRSLQATYPDSGGNDVSGTIISGGFNIIEDDAGFTVTVGDDSANDITGVDPGLNALALLGGTYVHSLTSSSIAINAATASTQTVDQRRVARDSTPDIGAYESRVAVQPDLLTTASQNGGLSINQDGGNDVFLIADNASFFSGDRLTAEFQISNLQNTGTSSTLFSNADGSGMADFKINSDGTLSFAGVSGSVANTATLRWRRTLRGFDV